MRGVMPLVPQHLLDWRRTTGADRGDEIWDGVLHMSPEATRFHQDFESQLWRWLWQHWARPQGNRVHQRVNVASPGGWPSKNYRVPDLVLLTPDRFHIDHNEYFEGGPTVVVEIRSPEDETYEKLPFYADVGVAESWVIDRDTGRPEIYVTRRRRPVKQEPSSDGWHRSAATGVWLRKARRQRLVVQLGKDEATRTEIPEVV